MVRTKVRDMEDLHWYVEGVRGAGGKEDKRFSVFWVYIYDEDVDYVKKRIVDSLVGDWGIEYGDPKLAEKNEYIDPPEGVRKVIKLTPPDS